MICSEIPTHSERFAGDELDTADHIHLEDKVELLDQTSNIDLLQNTLAWLVDEGDQISIRPNASAKNTLTLSDLDALIMWLLSAFVLPCLALGGAIATYMSRRKR